MIIIVHYEFRRKDETQQAFIKRCLRKANKHGATVTVTVNGRLVTDIQRLEPAGDGCMIMIQ